MTLIRLKHLEFYLKICQSLNTLEKYLLLFSQLMTFLDDDVYILYQSGSLLQICLQYLARA